MKTHYTNIKCIKILFVSTATKFRPFLIIFRGENKKRIFNLFYVFVYYFHFLAKYNHNSKYTTKIYIFLNLNMETIYRGADKSLARPGRKQATTTEDFDIPYLL
jgi:hypothetical protein